MRHRFFKFWSLGCAFFPCLWLYHNYAVLFAVRAEWESGGSSGDCLLQAVCRCSLAALLKHTGLQNEAYWQDRLVIQMLYLFWHTEKSTYMLRYIIELLTTELSTLSWDRYEPCEMLLDVYETVYKIRSTLLAHKNSPRTSQVQAAAKQVPLLKFLHSVSQWNTCGTVIFDRAEQLKYKMEWFVNNMQLNICTVNITEKICLTI